MATKGYCTTANVADYLGVTLSAAQTAQCLALIAQAEAFIDRETGRGWLMGAQTDEAHYYSGAAVYLKYAPVSSVMAVTGRTDLGDDETTLTAGIDYEVRDLETGLIVLESPWSYERIQVDYTPVATVPADITLACTEIVANWLQPQLQPGSYGLDSYSLPDLTVKFSRSHTQQATPPNAARILELYRYRVHG